MRRSKTKKRLEALYFSFKHPMSEDTHQDVIDRFYLVPDTGEFGYKFREVVYIQLGCLRAAMDFKI